MPAIENGQPCWEIVCDGCGAGDNAEEDGVFHYGSLVEAIEVVKELEWRVIPSPDDEPLAFFCSACWEEMSIVQRAQLISGEVRL